MAQSLVAQSLVAQSLVAQSRAAPPFLSSTDLPILMQYLTPLPVSPRRKTLFDPNYLGESSPRIGIFL